MILPPLNAIVDDDAASAAGWALGDLAAAYLAGGARFLQLRAKSMPGGALLDTAASIAAQARAAGAWLIVNDRADIARMARADGVHVGQADLPPAAVRMIVGDGALVGLSTHSTEQLQRALTEPVTYAAIGPVFSTRTKATGYGALGLEPVRRSAALARGAGVPLVAIGGITLDSAARVIEAGAATVAVIGDLLAGGDPERRVRDYLATLA